MQPIPLSLPLRNSIYSLALLQFAYSTAYSNSILPSFPLSAAVLLPIIYLLLVLYSLLPRAYTITQSSERLAAPYIPR
jgi:hypothetical protein